jgi:hypothetical protein
MNHYVILASLTFIVLVIILIVSSFHKEDFCGYSTLGGGKPCCGDNKNDKNYDGYCNFKN